MTQFYYFLAAEQRQPEELVAHAKLAEQAGFDGVMISEHFHPWVDDTSAAGFSFSTLGAIAQATDLALMTAVTTPLFRFHPAIIAQAAATIDRLSGGKFSLGIGMGRAHDEEPAGFQYPSYKERNGRMREAIAIMRGLLDGEKLTYQGNYYQTKTAKLYSPPIARVPIIMAAGGPQSAKLAGELCDGLMVSNKDTAETIVQAIEPAKSAAKDRQLQITAMQWMVLAENDEAAWEALSGQRGLRAPDRDSELDPEMLRKQVDDMPRVEVLNKFTIVQNATEIIEQYRNIVNKLQPDILGLQIASADHEKTISMLGSKVLPALRKEIT